MRTHSSTLSLAAVVLVGSIASAQFREVDKLKPQAPGTGQALGQSLACNAHTIVSGAPLDDSAGDKAGAVLVFTGSGAEWSQQALLTTSDADLDDRFGTRVALSGDTLVASAPFDDDNGDNSGAAYVFVRTGTSWSEQQKLIAPDGQSFDGLNAVAIDGDTVVLGASGADGVTNSTGAAYVFVRSGGVWSFQQKLVAADGAGNDSFGAGVGIDGDTVIAGAPGDDDIASSAGSAYVFARTGTVWSFEDKLVASGASSSDRFGTSVDVHQDTAVGGAHRHDEVGSNAGAAYVFARSGTTWSEQGKLTASDGDPSDELGLEVRVRGDRVLVGARNGIVGIIRLGKAYVFERNGTTWSEDQLLIANEKGLGGLFGTSVALDDDVLVVGDVSDAGAGGQSGAVHVFTTDREPGASGCFGVGCPCSDDAAAGCRNSTGSGALLVGVGGSSVGQDDLVLRAYRLPQSKLGVFIMGGSQPAVPLFDGLLCVSAPIFRFGTQIQSSGISGTITLREPASAAGGQIVPGTTWHFQAWYRDAAHCGGGSNLSNLYSVSFGL